MAQDDIEDLKKFNPRERIGRLRELEKKKRKEIEDAEKMIEDSIEEIKNEERVMEEVSIPEAREIDITRRFAAEEESTALERTVEKAELTQEAQERLTQYTSRLEELREEMYESPETARGVLDEAREITAGLVRLGDAYALSGGAARTLNVAFNIYDNIKKYRTR